MKMEKYLGGGRGGGTPLRLSKKKSSKIQDFFAMEFS